MSHAGRVERGEVELVSAARMDTGEIKMSSFPPAGATDGDWLDWANEWPASRALGIACEEISREDARYRVETDPFITNPNGAINGGIVAAIIDQVLGVTMARSLEPGQLPRTGTLQVQYHRPARPPLTLVVRHLPSGRRVRFLEVHVEDRDGNRCASGQGTMVSVTPRSSSTPS